MRPWQLGPVLRGIRGHRAAAVLVAVQFGIGLAITILAVLIGDYFNREKFVDTPSTGEITVVELQLAGGDFAARRDAALAGLRRIGAATTVGRVPLHALEYSVDHVHANGRSQRAAWFEGGPSIAHVGGLTLVAGRDFVDGDLDATVTAAIVSSALRMPVGTPFVSRAHGRSVVVGVVDEVRSHVFGVNPHTVVYARQHETPHVVILVRGGGAGLGERLREPGQHAVVAPIEDRMRHMDSPVGAVLGILGLLVGTIVFVVLIGSMGLTYFLVSARTREIGLRRAMGATRRDVVRYFLLENVLVTLAGAVVAFAIMLVVLPSLFYEQQGFDINVPLVAIAVASVVGLNLLATLIPARKAAAVPPIVASRAV